jgi:hypothetical protein
MRLMAKSPASVRVPPGALLVMSAPLLAFTEYPSPTLWL